MALCAVSGVIKDASETALSGVVVEARPINPYFNSTTQIVPKTVTTTTDASGIWSLSLSQTGTFTVTIMYPPNDVDSARRYNYTITVPAASSANFSTLATEL